MDSQIIHSRTVDKNHEQEPHHVAGHHDEGEDEEHHEKTSVLKKVKAKAKKIKDTIRKHAQGDHHDEHHDGQHSPNHHDLDEEDGDDDEEEEMVQDPEIHGAPIYESAAMKSAVHGQAHDLAHPPGAHFERSNAVRDAPLESGEKHQTNLGGPIGGSPPKENITEPLGFGSKMAMGEGATSPANTPVSKDIRTDGQPDHLFTTRPDQEKDTESTDPRRTFVDQKEKSEETKVNLGSAMGLKENPNGPSGISGSSASSNAQSKVAEPSGAGAGEVGVTPIIDSLGKMKIHDDSEDKVKPDGSSNSAETRINQMPSTGSHEQFNPEPMATDTSTLSSEGHPQQAPNEKQANRESYTAKISSATSAIADKAVSAKNVLASKLGYTEKDESRDAVMKNNEVSGGGNVSHETTKSGSAMEYGKKIASAVTEKLSPVYEKVAGAGTAVMSTVTGTGASSNTSGEGEVVKQDKSSSVTGYLAEKLRPGEDDKALSEVISDALHKRKAEPSKTEERPLGRVTESEEVARQLGTGDDITSKREQESYIDSPGTGVIDKVKGAVGSWFGRSQESQTSTGVEGMSRNTRKDVDEETNAPEGRRLQQSSD